MADNTVKATDATLPGLISGPKPVLVDFWAAWCRPCLAVAPLLEEIAAEYPTKITVAKLNIDENQQAVLKYGVQGIPTMIVFRNGQPTATRIVGQKDKATLLRELAPYLA